MSSRLRSKPALLTAFSILLLVLGSAFVVPSLAEDAPDYLKTGDTEFEEKSYRKAYEAYEQYLKSEPETPELFRIRLRMGHCQIQLGNHDKAEAELVALADSDAITDLQRARANYRLGRYYAERPGYYYENSKGERSWGRWIADSRHHNVSRSNAENAKDRLLKAYEGLSSEFGVRSSGTDKSDESKDNAEHRTPNAEQFNEVYNAGMDAAAALHTWQYHQPNTRQSVDYLDSHGQKQTYYFNRHEFPDRDQILKLYDELVRLSSEFEVRSSELDETEDNAEHRTANTEHHAPLALYRKGAFLLAMTQIDDWQVSRLLYHPDIPDFDPLEGDYSPLPVFESIYKDYHETSFADDAQFFIGYALQQVGRHQEAEAAFETLVNDEVHKDSTETASARAALQQLRAQRLSVKTLAGGLGAPAQDNSGEDAQENSGEGARTTHKWHANVHWQFRENIGTSRSTFKKEEQLGLWVETRNVAEFKVRALTFDLPAFMRDEEFLNAEAAGFDSLGNQKLTPVIERYVGEQVFEQTYETGDDGKRNYTRTTLAMPEALPPGSYLVEVNTGGVLDRRLVVVAESQVVVQTYNEDENLALLLNAETGEPLSNVQYIYKRWRTYWSGNTMRWQIDHTRFQGDEHGRVRLPAADTVAWSGYLVYAESQGRYAFVQSGFQGWQRRSSRPSTSTRIYPITDRPVYRPGHEVHGKIIMRQRTDGEWRNVAGTSAFIEVRDPRGETRLERIVAASEFGAFEYDLRLPDDAALGNWRVYLRRGRGGAVYGSAWFAVEEYKKPEVEVTVAPPDKPVKLGEAIGATIKGEYYFGGPATGAEVSYKVYRDFYWHSVYFPRRFDWLYNWRSPQRYGTPDQQFRRNLQSELITEGTGTLDENGELVIEWSTAKALEDWPEFDHRYRVTAEVTDSSRRTIMGEGSVKALRRAFFAFVDNKLGFYRPGDKLDVEVRTVTAEDKPVSAEGKLEIYRVTFEKRIDEDGLPKIDEHKALLATHDLNTDERGLAFFREKVEESGTLELVFRTQDEWGTEIVGTRRIIVKATTWQPGSYNFGTLSLIPQQKVYVQGETARVLLASDYRDAWMLISVMGGMQVISQSFVNVSETAGQFELEIPINRKHVPNFHVNVMTVQRGELHTDTIELFVPPDEQFLEVQVTSDKEWYQPGETGTLTVTAKDKDGKPVDAEFALTVFDRSVTYIVPDSIPNIMTHFYGDRRSYRLNFTNSYTTSVDPVQHDRQEYEQLRWYGAPLGWGVRNWMQWERSHFDFDADTQDRAQRYRDGFASKGGSRSDDPTSEDEPAADSAEGGLRQEESENAVGLGGGASGGMVHRRARGGGAMDADGAPTPPSAAPKAEAARELDELERLQDKAEANDWGGEAAEDAGMAAPRIRSEFKDTAFYSHRVRTGPAGETTVKVEFPDNLTDWRIAARGITKMAKVGEAFHSVKTSKQLILRDQAPRFFVEGDVVTLSGVIMNRYDTALEVQAMLLLNPKDAATADEMAAFASYQLFPETPDVQMVSVPANGEIRVDWRVRMTGAGSLKLRMLALSSVESDATEKNYNVKVRGAEMVQGVAAVINDDEKSRSFTVSLPEQMDVEQTYMDLQLSPSVAALAMDAIPYLLEFPYGCVEQTMSRFLPAVIVRKTLQDTGISLEDIGKRRAQLAYDGVNPQAAYWYKRNPVFDTATLNAILDAGLRRLGVMQQRDGGWGWWSGGQADMYMSAYVIYGLHTAREANLPFDYAMLDRGIEFLSRQARTERNLNRAAYSAYVLSYVGKPDKELLDKLFERRDDLTHQTRAMLCMAQHLAGDAERARILLSNIEDYRKEDLDAGTVWWDGGNQYWWWWNDRIETNAFVMRAFTMVDPTNQYLDKHVRWLAQNRKGSRWNSTKDTSHAVAALMDYARVSGELSRSYTVTVKLGGEPVHTWDVTPENVFALQTNVRLRGSELPPGEHVFTIEREGEGRVYFSSFVSYFSKEEKLKATGNHIAIERKYFRLIEKQEEVTVKRRMADGTVREVKEMRTAYDRELLEYGAQLRSGDLVEVELGLTADNDYEYLMFEDFKPAGCEPVALRSGGGRVGGLVQNVELRDDRTAFFVSYMPQGYARLTYQLRCEIPGTFSALPTQGGSMYVTEVKANSEEFKLSIVDR